MTEKQQKRLTVEGAKALADKVIENAFVPKKIPPVDDIDAQTRALGGALSSALLTATELPLHMLQPVVAELAAQLVALGVRQTEHVDQTAMHAPTWIVDGMRDQSVKLPDPPKPAEAPPVVKRTATAPPRPARLTKKVRAVRR